MKYLPCQPFIFGGNKETSKRTHLSQAVKTLNGKPYRKLEEGKLWKKHEDILTSLHFVQNVNNTLIFLQHFSIRIVSRTVHGSGLIDY